MDRELPKADVLVEKGGGWAVWGCVLLALIGGVQGLDPHTMVKFLQGIGGNLLAGLLQRAADGHRPTGEELRQVRESGEAVQCLPQLLAQPDVVSKLDRILERTRQIQQGMEEDRGREFAEHRAIFQQGLQAHRDLRQLLEATSAEIAAVYKAFCKQQASVLTPAPGDRIEVATVDETRYREWLAAETDMVDVRGIAKKHVSQPLRLPLRELYAELRGHPAPASNPGGAPVTPLAQPLVQVTDSNRLVALIGDPGSGKTTFVRYRAHTLLESPAARLPLLMRASSVSQHMQNHSGGTMVHPHSTHLVRYWLQTSEEYGWGLTEGWLRSRLERGEAALLVDGIDEVAGSTAREYLVALIDAAVREWPLCQWIVTSRPEVLRGPAAPLGFSPFVIEPLTQEDIGRFVRAWASLLIAVPGAEVEAHRSLADRYAGELLEAVMDPEIRDMACNPLMLTAMAVLHWHLNGLPRCKADLFDAMIQWLVDQRRVLPGRVSAEATRRCYQVLALSMCRDTSGRQTRVGVDKAAKVIGPCLPAVGDADPTTRARAFLEQEKVDTGIIVERDAGFLQFWHLTFQEYLAACEIAHLLDPKLTRLVKAHIFNPEWREILRFVAARLEGERATEYVRRLLRVSLQAPLSGKAWVFGLTGGILADMGEYPRGRIVELPEYQNTRTAVMGIFSQAGLQLELPDRYDAAVTLGRVGDPRFLDPEANWVRVPGARVPVGAQNTSPEQPHFDDLAYQNEQPVHEVYTGSFEIGRYPVTVGEYQAFVRDGGYGSGDYWCSDGWQWRISEQAECPLHWEDQLRYPNCPVVYVSWYEAEAYCRWLCQKTPAVTCRLPMEAEWEYVARRGHDGYQRFIFGSKHPLQLKSEISWDSGLLRRLAPVGLFPRDETSDGVRDMNGNVLEWTAERADATYPQGLHLASAGYGGSLPSRVLRGGSWNFTALECRLANRERRKATHRFFDGGFRVVRHPKPLAIKGRAPQMADRPTLADVFARYDGVAICRADAEARLRHYDPRFAGVIQTVGSRLFPAHPRKPRQFHRLPCVMGEAPLDKLDLNLRYQDTRVKIAAEDALGPGRDLADYVRDAERLMDIIAVLLRTTGFGSEELWRDLTDNDLDGLVYVVLDAYDSCRQARLLEAGHDANARALAGYKEFGNRTWRDLLIHQVFAGVVWWPDRGWTLASQFNEKRALALDDWDAFVQGAHSGSKRMVFFFDDNGELVWDLAVVERLLRENNALHVTGVINPLVVANNANTATLSRCLEDPAMTWLRSCPRLHLFPEENLRSSIDPCFCSDQLLSLLEKADFAVVKGTAAFETMQDLPVDTFYAFVVHGPDAATYSGFQRGEGILARVPRGIPGYRYGRSTLKDVHTLASRPRQAR